MMSLYTKRRMADLIKNIAEGEIKTEVVRQVLAEKELFEPYSAFKRVSNFTSNVTSLNLREFLEDNNLLMDKKEAYVIIRMFDSNGDGKLSFTEFLNAILPQDEPYLRKEATVRPNFKILEGEKLPYEVEYGLMRIFEEELKTFHKCERIRRELALYDDFALMAGFRELDVFNYGFLDMESIAIFMEKAGKPMDDAELKAFMRRVDKDGDGKITYSEYLDNFYSADSDEVLEEIEQFKSRSRYTSPKREVKQKDDEYMGYLRKAYTSPKRKTDMMRKSADNFASPSKKLSFEEDFGYKTPTKKTSEMKMSESDLYQSGSKMSASKKSPLKPKDEQELVKVLKEIVDYNREVETIKNDLALRKDFNLFNAFNIFDVNRKGYVTSKELERGLNQFNIYPTKDELFLLMKRFDPNLDGIVKFTDFSDLFTPSSPEFAKLLATRQPYYISEEEDERDLFSVETNMMITKFLKTLYNGEIMVEAMRQQLAKRPLFSVHDAFKTLDKYNQGYIMKDDFKEIFEEYGIFVTQKDVKSLVERCEHEMKGEGKVTYTDFLREMSPKSLVSY